MILASRPSKLALAQAEEVASLIRKRHPDLAVEIRTFRTAAEKFSDRPLASFPERGIFTKEIQEAVLRREADAAVHSLKDLPTDDAPGLCLAAITERADPRDCLIARTLPLPRGAVIATSSLRRRVQLARLRPDLKFTDVRGNIQTRLAKLGRGEFDGLVLACAGLIRAGLLQNPTAATSSLSIPFPSPMTGTVLHLSIAFLSTDDMLPAVGQGMLAVETRADDPKTRRAVMAAEHQRSRWAALAERAFLTGLGGGCRMPFACYAREENGVFVVEGMTASPDGSRYFRDKLTGDWEQAEDLGRRLAEKILSAGASSFLKAN